MNSTMTATEAKAIAREAYLFAFPMLMGYRFAYATFLQPASPAYRGPANSGPFGKAVPLDHTFKDVITPNSDTPYSFALLDLRAGPVVVSAPEISGRYYVLQFEDLLGFNELFVGSRATGTEAQRWFLMGPRYEGDVPDGFDGSHRFETELVFLLGRTQLLDPADQADCGEVMASYRVEPNSSATAPATEWPAWIDEASRDERFIGYLNALLPLCEPLHPADADLFERMEQLGIGAGRPFDAAALDPDIRDAIRAGVSEARAAMPEAISAISDLVDGWQLSRRSPFGNRAHYDGDYLLRASAAMLGWGGNDLVEASYPLSRVDADGDPYDGRATYRLRLDSDPPVRAFWSVTMYDTSYDGAAGYLVENPIDRYLISSTTEGLVRDKDGGLVITLQRDEPTDPVERANWLPTPDGPFYLSFRLYWPEASALDGSWTVPPVRRID